MTVTLNFSSELEQELAERASERGLSVDHFLQEIVSRAVSDEGEGRVEAANLSDLLLNSPFAGANLDLDRLPDFPRPSDIS